MSAAIADELTAVIHQLRKHQASHQSWLDHFRADPNHSCGKCTPDVLAGVGDAVEQEVSVKVYDGLIDRVSKAQQALRDAALPAGRPQPVEYPRVINDDGELRLEQTSPPNSFLQVVRNSDGKEIASTPCVTTEPKDEIIRLLLGAWVKCNRPDAAAGRGAQGEALALQEFVELIAAIPTDAEVQGITAQGAIYRGPNLDLLIQQARAALRAAPQPTQGEALAPVCKSFTPTHCGACGHVERDHPPADSTRTLDQVLAYLRGLSYPQRFLDEVAQTARIQANGGQWLRPEPRVTNARFPESYIAASAERSPQEPHDYDRLRQQALVIERILRDAGCPQMSLEAGVQWLANRSERIRTLEQENETLKAAAARRARYPHEPRH